MTTIQRALDFEIEALKFGREAVEMIAADLGIEEPAA